MRYISLFSGIEACTVAWKGLNWDAVAFADFDDFPSAVLEHHYPDVPNLKDVVKVDWSKYEGAADLVVGGSPCQSFSVAGKRLGMDDPRGNLALHYLRVVGTVRPKWFLYENVPGLLSSNEGDDFAIFLGEVAKLGYGFAYRVLDAQHFGVPQRRRRVFVVGCADGDWRSAAAVLFDKQSLQGNLASSRQEGKEDQSLSAFGLTNESRPVGRGIDTSKPAGSLTAGMYHHGSINNQCLGTNAHLIMEEDQQVFENHPTDGRIRKLDNVAPTVRARFGTGGGNLPLVMEKGIIHAEKVGPTMGASGPPYSRTGNERVEAEALVVQKSAIPIHDQATRFSGKRGDKNDGKGNGFGVGKVGDPSNTLTQGDRHAVFQQQGVDLFNQELTGDLHCPLRTAGGHGAPAMMDGAIVRRLTPLECERLQGFPDNYTQIPWNGKPAEECPDSHRYKGLGNSMAVPVMQWIGERIDMMDSADLSNRSKPKARKQMTLW